MCSLCNVLLRTASRLDIVWVISGVSVGCVDWFFDVSGVLGLYCVTVDGV